MKIMQVVHCFPPEPMGGTERVAAALTGELARRGHELQVVAGSLEWQRGAGVSREEWEGIPVTRIRRDDPWFDRWDNGWNPEVEGAFRQELRRVRPDLVHIHHWLRLTRGLVRICAAEGIPALVQLHDFQATCPRTFRLVEGGEICRLPAGVDRCLGCVERWPFQGDQEVRRQLDHYLRDMANELVQAQARLALSRAQAELLAAVLPGEAGSIDILPAPSPSVLRPRATTPPGEALRLVHWGNLYDLKGVGELIEAVGWAAGEIPVRLDIYGEATEPGFARELEEKAAGKPVTLHGSYRREELEEVAADLAVFPSRCWETYGLVVDEAFMLGLPVVVTRAGALPERIGAGGLAIAPGDMTELARVILRLGRDREELARLAGGVGKCWTTAAEAAHRAEGLYEEILAGRRRSSPPLDPVTGEERLLLHWFIASARLASLAGSPVASPPPWREEE